MERVSDHFSVDEPAVWWLLVGFPVIQLSLAGSPCILELWPGYLYNPKGLMHKRLFVLETSLMGICWNLTRCVNSMCKQHTCRTK